MDRIAILDFGSQYTQLIARRIREMGVLTEILSSETSVADLGKELPKGIIFSGSPSSTGEGPSVDRAYLDLDIPILGICYGMQLMNVIYEGSVTHLGRGEYGPQRVSLSSKHALFRGLEPDQTVWMSHGDSIENLASCFEPIGHSHDGIIAAVAHRDKRQYGVQFHPEVMHTQKGAEMIGNFLDLCACGRDWTIGNQIETIKDEIRDKVGSGFVVSLVSGGVDSTVSTLLCTEALGADRVYPLHIDTGLMRVGESEQVCRLLKEYGMEHLIFVDAKEEFLTALEGVSDPEDKRRIIGDLFIQILDREMAKLDRPNMFFCQGTLYTDLIESGKGCGKNAAVIKSHHNVNPPIVQKKRADGLIVEPNAQLFKDEVRRVCEALKVPRHLAWRHPFPGPGLAIRILGEVTSDRIAALQQADAIYLEEITKAGLYDEIWQAFAVLLPVKAVGVMGDKRTEGNVIALRAVTSADGMTADFYHMPHDVLGRISGRIINEVSSINRVVYDVTAKPPGTIEWE